jgi:hypothetical protein
VERTHGALMETTETAGRGTSAHGSCAGRDHAVFAARHSIDVEALRENEWPDYTKTVNYTKTVVRVATAARRLAEESSPASSSPPPQRIAIMASLMSSLE